MLRSVQFILAWSMMLSNILDAFFQISVLKSTSNVTVFLEPGRLDSQLPIEASV